jgi:hypothetical protein
MNRRPIFYESDPDSMNPALVNDNTENNHKASFYESDKPFYESDVDNS